MAGLLMLKLLLEQFRVLKKNATGFSYTYLILTRMHGEKSNIFWFAADVVSRDITREERRADLFSSNGGGGICGTDESSTV